MALETDLASPERPASAKLPNAPGRVRRLPIGVEMQSDGGAHARIWAPKCDKVAVVLDIEAGKSLTFALAPEGDGYFSGDLPAALPGLRYAFQVDGRSHRVPDPASRFQPQGPHGPSEIVEPGAFGWTDSAWRGIAIKGQVLYELHVGTFTREGTWDAARAQLRALADLGVTAIELMPVAEFAGRFGWGYDCVDLFAPYHRYGPPDAMRRFVDAAHAAGLGVILDVVYNHFGPDGNYLNRFSDHYVTDRYENEWGDAINFDGPRSGPVREFFLTNAAYWIEEFHLDGFRLDATQQIFDRSPTHILADLKRRTECAARGRATIIVGENEPQHARLIRPVERGGFGLDALWNDDLHHSAMVATTGRSEAYYTDYRGAPQEFVSAVKWGFLYQGQRYAWQKKRRGTPSLDLEPSAFVSFLQNHDQIANSARGERIHRLTSAGRYRAMTAMMLLAPATPILFQGQEFAASAPFLYFADHKPAIAKAIRDGRREFLSQFPSLATPAVAARLSDPGDPATFERCKLDHRERDVHREAYDLHRDLLRLRREDAVFSAQRRGGVDGAVLGPEAFVLRFFGAAGDDRLLLINLGRDLHLDPVPEPLLAPPEEREWRLIWSSEDPRYGGSGTGAIESRSNWRVPSHAAAVLAAGRDG